MSACNVARVERKVCGRVWLENLKEGDCVDQLGIDGILLLEWMFKKYDGSALSGFFRLIRASGVVS
jgi:hypothetical protein